MTPCALEPAGCQCGWMYLCLDVRNSCTARAGAAPEAGPLRAEGVQWQKSRWLPSGPGQAAGAVQGCQQGCPGMVWCGCWLTLPPRQGAAMLACCLSPSAGHGPLGPPQPPVLQMCHLVTQVLGQFTSCPSPQGQPVPPGPCPFAALPASAVQAL